MQRQSLSQSVKTMFHTWLHHAEYRDETVIVAQGLLLQNQEHGAGVDVAYNFCHGANCDMDPFSEHHPFGVSATGSDSDEQIGCINHHTVIIDSATRRGSFRL